MDHGGFSSSYEQDSLVGELMQGMELAKQLKALMDQEVGGGGTGMLAEKIHSSFEKALLIVKWGGSMEQSQQNVVPASTTPASPLSVIGSPKSEDFNTGFSSQQDCKDLSRKRKKLPSWTDQVKASSESADGPPEDGHSWRKYGQKDILGAKYPRSYYRCTYRHIQGCCAVRQVQRNDEDFLLFGITYKGTHTCTPRSKSAPTSPEKQERNKQHQFPIKMYQQHAQSNMLLSFQTGLTIDTQNLENQEMELPLPTSGSVYENHTFTPSTTNDNFCSGFPQSFTVSPANSTSNYFSTSHYNINPFGGVHHGQHSESEFTEIFSGTTSGANSPIMGLDYSLEQMDFNPNFPYDNQAFPYLP